MNFLSLFIKKIKIKRDRRYSIGDLYEISMAIDGEQYKIQNISKSGLGFISKKVAKTKKLNDEILLSIRIKNEIFNVSAKIIRIKSQFVGATITSHKNFFEKNVEAYFKD